jgi:hypothetical protein
VTSTRIPDIGERATRVRVDHLLEVVDEDQALAVAEPYARSPSAPTTRSGREKVRAARAARTNAPERSWRASRDGNREAGLHPRLPRP